MFNGGTLSSNLFFKTQQAVIDEGTAHLRRLSRLPTLWQKAQNIRKGATPSEVVYEMDRLRLLHYRGERPPKYRRLVPRTAG